MTHNTPARIGLRGARMPEGVPADETAVAGLPHGPLRVDARDVARRFGRTVALDGVSLAVRAGEIHALLGPNAAGKTTLMRILSGIMEADEGLIRVAGCDPARNPRELRQRVGLVPGGDRTLYLRLSGLENLLFFARLHGLRRRAALARANEVLELVGLTQAARTRVGFYSHGMQKRLSVARSLLVDPVVLLVDEATHDLDPQAADTVRRLVRDLAERGTAVVWTTQRVDEVRGLADTVTILSHGALRFAGTVPELLAHAETRRFLVHLRNSGAGPEALAQALGDLGSIRATRDGDSEHYLLALREGAALGDALAVIRSAGFQLLGCRDERSEVEEAFLSLTREERT